MSLACEWFVLAERVICDAETNSLTLVNCLERVTALRFPAQHPGFAAAARYRWDGPPLTKTMTAQYRIVRLSEGAEPEVVTELQGDWSPGNTVRRVWVRFQFLRLRHPEVLRFRIDSRLGRKAWVEGPSCSIEIVQAELTDEQRARFQQEAQAKGLVVEGLD